MFKTKLKKKYNKYKRKEYCKNIDAIPKSEREFE